MLLMRIARRSRAAVIALSMLPGTAQAEPVITKTYSYFRIGGTTANELDDELTKRGPAVRVSGHRHPGATEIRFGGDITYVEKDGRCRIGSVRVTLTTRLILPRWSNRNRAGADLRFVWDTLSSDIKRHEERHAEIARNHAWQLDRDLRALPSRRHCTDLEKQVAEVTRRMVERHDGEQARFDRIEGANFDARMTRLLNYRLEQSAR